MNQQMIAKRLPLLAGALVAQVALAGVLFWRDSAEVVTPEPLLTVETGEVTRVELADAGQSVVLNKNGGRWYLGENLPADGQRVTTMLENLAALKSGWPVAKSSDAQQRFEVSADKFQRKVSLAKGETELGTLLFGSSPAYRQVHVRAADQDEIFALTFDVFNMPANQDNWLDASLLRPAGDIQRISSGDTVLHKQDGQWSDAGGAKGERIAKALAELKVLGLAKDLASLDAPAGDSDGKVQQIAIEVESASRKYTYELISKSGEYYIRRDDFQPTFRLSKSEYDVLAALGKESGTQASG